MGTGRIIQTDNIDGLRTTKNFLSNGLATLNTTGWSTFNAVNSASVDDVSENCLTVGGHNIPVGMVVAIKVLSVSTPCGLTVGNTYYANSITSTLFYFTNTPGGATVNITAVANITYAEIRPRVPSGTANITWGVTTTNPLSDAKSFLLTKDAANRQYQGVMTDFTIDNAYKAKVLNTYMDYIVDSGTFVAGSNTTDSDVIIYLYDVTNNQVIEPSSYKLLSNSTTIADRYSSSFQTPYNSTSYRLVILVASASTAAYALKMDNVGVSPSNYVYGTPITDWKSYPMAIGATTTAPTKPTTTLSDAAYWRQVGDSMEITYNISWSSVTGAAAGSGNYLFPLPSGYTINTAKLGVSGTNTSVGIARAADATNAFNGQAIVYNSTNLLLSGKYTAYGSSSSITDIAIGSAGYPLNSSNGTTYINFTARVPILGWSSSVQVSDGYDGRVVATRAYRNATTQTITTTAATKVQYNALSYDATGSYDSVTNYRFVAPTPGYYSVLASVFLSNYTANEVFNLQIFKNGVQITGNDETSPSSSFIATVSDKVQMNAGDYIEIYAKSTADTNYDIIASAPTCFFCVEKLAGNPVISATELIAVRASNTAGTTIATGAGTNPVPYATVQTDTTGAWNGTTFTAPTAGLYEVTQHAYFGSTAWTVSGKNIQVLKNGTLYSYLKLYIPAAAYTEALGMEGTDIVPLNAGETISFGIQHNEAATKSLSTAAGTNYISIKRVK